MTAVPSIPSTPRFVLHRTQSAAGNFPDDVRRGLTAQRKSLPPRWFYDELGSALFDTICFLPEYYVTRAETEVLTAHAAEINDFMPSVAQSPVVALLSNYGQPIRRAFFALFAALELAKLRWTRR